jgi:hypothetical protein
MTSVSEKRTVDATPITVSMDLDASALTVLTNSRRSLRIAPHIPRYKPKESCSQYLGTLKLKTSYRTMPFVDASTAFFLSYIQTFLINVHVYVIACGDDNAARPRYRHSR